MKNKKDGVKVNLKHVRYPKEVWKSIETIIDNGYIFIDSVEISVYGMKKSFSLKKYN